MSRVDDARNSRLGRFAITSELLMSLETRPSLLAMTASMTILQAEYHADTDCYRYLAISDLFEALEEGVDTPWYRMQFLKEDLFRAIREDGRVLDSAPVACRLRRIVRRVERP